MQGDTSSLNSRKITLAMMEHKGSCGSASREESSGLHLPERAVTGEGPLFRVHVPTGLGQSRRGSTEEWSPAEPCRVALGIAVGAKTAEFCSSHYSLESHTCWNTAGPEELSVQEKSQPCF